MNYKERFVANLEHNCQEFSTINIFIKHALQCSVTCMHNFGAFVELLGEQLTEQISSGLLLIWTIQLCRCKVHSTSSLCWTLVNTKSWAPLGPYTSTLEINQSW